jgi:V/A-type H+-transporting ATPase subunit K
MTQGATISASTAIEKGRASVWGSALSLFGTLLVVFGFLTGYILMMETINPTLTLFTGSISFLAVLLVTLLVRSGGDNESVKRALDQMGTWGVITSMIILGGVLALSQIGGGELMIPESAWPLLMGALTMIGSGLAAALCIMTAVRSGSQMLTEKPELSIWALLFVALGEGLAIYGLIVAILLIG